MMWTDMENTFSYEQAYKNALERARKVHRNYKNLFPEDSYSEDIEEIFPELRESEDERIRKWIIKVIEQEGFRYLDETYDQENALAWLEKQKEQKPVEWSEEDSVKPKFKPGMANVLKSLRPQKKRECNDCAMFFGGKCTKPHWKPSEEQMEALDFAVTYLFSTKQNPTYLRDLYDDLKKLMED